MKIKRFLSFILALCLTACTITAPAAQVTEKADTIPENITGLLKTIGVIMPDDKDTDDVVSRGQFAVYTARLFGDSVIGGGKKYYNDVPEGSFCFEAVSLLVELGALSVGSERTFNPHTGITYREACKILMCVLGFKDYAQVKGGYPAGFELVAKQNGLNDDLNGIEMTQANVLKMMYNACFIKVADIIAVDDSYTTREQGNETILSLSRDIYYIKGKVEKHEAASIIDGGFMNDGMVQINGVQMNAGNTGVENLLGHYVEVFFEKPQKDVPGTAVFCNNLTEIVEIDIEDSLGYVNGTLKYYSEKSDRNKQEVIGTKVPVLLNGVPVREKISNAFNDTQYGSISLGYYGNDLIVVHIRRAETMVVRYTNENQKMAWDEYRNSKHFIFDEEKYDRFNMYEAKSGTRVTFNHLQKGHVLTIYKSLDGKTTDVYVSDASITGTINQIKKDEVEIDGIFYEVNKELEQYLKLKTGLRVCVYLDVNGKICVVEPASDTGVIAYLYGYNSNNGPFETSVKIKVFTEAGEHKVVEIKLPVNVDGQRKKTVAELETALLTSGDRGTYRQLVILKFNSNGEVRQIDTAADSVDAAESIGSLVTQVKYTGEETEYFQASGYQSFYPGPVPYKGTKVFVVPEETYASPSELNFRITDKSFFNKTGRQKISSYKIDQTQKYADVIVVRSATTGSVYETDMPVMVNEIFEKVDKNGDVVKVINGVQQGALFEGECSPNVVFCGIDKTVGATPAYTVMTSVDDLQKGDLIRTANDSEGKICLIQVLHDFEENKKPYWFGLGQYADTRAGELRSVSAQFTLTAGYVIDKWVDKERKWNTVERPPALVDIGFEDAVDIDRTVVLGSDTVTVYDIENDKIFSGSCDDITAYNSGYGGSYMFVASVNYSTRGIYIYVYPGGK